MLRFSNEISSSGEATTGWNLPVPWFEEHQVFYQGHHAEPWFKGRDEEEGGGPQGHASSSL